MDPTFFRMEIFMREIFIRELKTGKENTFIRMEILMKELGKMTKKMEKVSISIQIKMKNISVIIEEERKKVRVLISLAMETNFKVNLELIKGMDKEDKFLELEKILKEIEHEVFWQ